MYRSNKITVYALLALLLVTQVIAAISLTEVSSNQAAITTGGTERLRVNSTGAYIVGIINATGSITGSGAGLTSIPASAITGTAWTQSSLTNLNQLTNGPGYINDTVSGVLKVTGSIIHEDSTSAGYIAHPEGGYYQTTASSVSGAIEICLPTHGTADMISFSVDIFNYVADDSVSMKVFGYLYQTTGNNEWVNEAVTTLSSTSGNDHTVRFGTNGTNHCIWIGETTDTWAYPQVVVRDFYGGLSTDIDAYATGWSIRNTTTFGTTDDNITTNLPYSDWNKIENMPADFSDGTDDGITDDTSVPKNHLTNSGTLGFTWNDSEVSDTLTASFATNAGTLDSIDSTSFLRSDAADTATGKIEFTGSSVGAAYGTDGKYTENASAAYGGSIWVMDAAYMGGLAGPNATPPTYGLMWIRGTHQNVSADIGEGIYVFQGATLEGGIGTSGIYSVGTITGATIDTGAGAKEVSDSVGNCAATDVHKGDGGCEAESSLSVASATSATSATSADDLSCTDCIGATEISDVYLLNTGDTATGSYTFDTNTLYIDSASDEVGIGTASPVGKLQVNGSLTATGFSNTGASITGTELGYLSKGILRVMNSGTLQYDPMSYEAVNHTFLVGTAGGTTGMTISSTGTVNAVGYTEGGSNTLSNNISGNAATANDLLSCTDCIGATEISDVYLLNTGDTATGDYNFDSNTLFINSTSNWVGIGTNAPTAQLTLASTNPNITFVGASSTAMITGYQSGTGSMILQTNFASADIIFNTAGANTRMTINETGVVHVGSGTNDYATGVGELYVQNDVEVDGDLYVSGQAYGVAPSMYLTSTGNDGDHNCDATPSNCCATGYHMCSHYEVLQGGREIETSGTGRDTTPFGGLGVNTAGQVVAGGNTSANTAGADCNSYTNISSSGYFTICYVNLTGQPNCQITAACSGAYMQWCCSD